MAEQVHKTQQYQYTANSNLVLQADRSSLPRREQEPSGEPESLYGRISMKNFGDLSRRSADHKEKLEKKRRLEGGKSGPPQKKESKDRSRLKYGPRDVLSVTEDYELDDVYRPKTRETRAVFELILSFIQGYIGAIPPEVLRSAASEVLLIIKDVNKKDLDKKKDVEETLGESITPEKFSQLLNLGKRIVDFRQSVDEEQEVSKDGVEDDHGVAVIFDENESEDSSGESEIEEEEESEEELERVRFDNKVSDHEEDEKSVRSDDMSIYMSMDTGRRRSEPLDKKPEELDPHQVDAFWLQRTVSNYYPDAHMLQAKSSKALELLSSSLTTRDCENELMFLFDYDKFSLVKLFIQNRDLIVWCTKLSRAASIDEKEELEKKMKEAGLGWILLKLKVAPKRKMDENQRRGVVEMDEDPMKYREDTSTKMDVGHKPPQDVENEQAITPHILPNFKSLVFAEGGHLMSNKKCFLPQGTTKVEKDGYQEIHVPAPKTAPMGENERFVSVSEMPKWAQGAFRNTRKLNRIQSRVYNVAFETDENMIICAPTGSGKTNCALLTIMREIGKFFNPETNTINLDAFKIVYIAPMKALVAELVRNFSTALEEYNIKVSELTGDTQMTKKIIIEAQLVVATPEKWDIVTRKNTERTRANLVTLMILDEIHLLHDDRGPVLETLVTRVIRSVNQTMCSMRLVGLSATIPNYVEIARFLRVDVNKGVFFFDNSYRPCPLRQQYIGISEKKAMSRYKLMNGIVYTKVKEEAGKSQVLIFCHSRKDTARTARAIRDMAVDQEVITQILRQDAASREILQTEAATAKDPDLQDLLPHGFAIHHAGMSRADRTLVGELFSDGHVQVLASTATLAWGVNLPAHTVIIKGTQIYNPEKGRWVELSPQDILQMLGRAGRPQYDTYGEGIIITTHSELQYYLSLLNQQLPIESQLMSKVEDNLNAEIVLGSIKNRYDAIKWLGYTYLYSRMISNGPLYGVSAEELEKDPYLLQRRTDIIHTAAINLEKCNLVKYDKRTGYFQTTELGRIASHYYVSYRSIDTYNQHLKIAMSIQDVLKVFSLSQEFKCIAVREEEKLEMTKLLERVPIPVKEGPEEATAKINVLLQCHISQIKLEGFALMSDMVYIIQNAGRILRAIFEMCLRRGWAQLTRQALNLCKMVDKRTWQSSNPLRQIRGFPMQIIKRLERKEFPWSKYFDLNPQELGELAGMPKAGKIIHKAVHQFPKLDLQVHVQPLTRSVLKFELTITPDFQFDEKNCTGGSEIFWVFVENCDGDIILYYDMFILKQQYVDEDHSLVFTVPLTEPLPSNYFVSIISDAWLNCEIRLPVPFKHLILPEKHSHHTELLDLQPLPISALHNEEYERVYSDISHFNAIQTQVFNVMFKSNENVFIGAPYGSGKTVCAEFALLRLWSEKEKSRCVYIAPFEEVVELMFNSWKNKFESLAMGKKFVSLTGETSTDLKLLEIGDVIFSTAQNWDVLSRRWKQRKNVQTVSLFIVSDVHLLGGNIGPTMEIIISRMRYVSAQTNNEIRIVAMGISLTNALDLGEWIGTTPQSTFNFKPNVRQTPLEIHIRGYPVGQNFMDIMFSLMKPTYLALSQCPRDMSAIIFASSRKLAQMTASELLSYTELESQINSSESVNTRFSEIQLTENQKKLINGISDPILKGMASKGIAYYHEVLGKLDRRIIDQLFNEKAVHTIVASRETCWALPHVCNHVIIMGSQYYGGKEHQYVDYTIAEVLKMAGYATECSRDEVCRCLLICRSTKKEFYKKFIYEALPIESHLDQYLHDHFNAEIVTKIIENKQDAVDYLTWTFFYRRLGQNPNYYNLKGLSSRHLSDHLSELVENTLDDLSNNKCILIEDTNVSPLNLGLVAAYYYTSYITIEIFSIGLNEKLKIRGLLQILAAAVEFEDIPIRHHERSILSKVYECVPVKTESPNFNDPHFKTHVLLQAHFMRLKLPPDLEYDQRMILRRVFRLVQCLVDVISSDCWLSTSIAAIELAQMIVQAIWNFDSPLKQIPHITQDIIAKFKECRVENVLDVIYMEDSARKKVLEGLPARQVSEIADFVNKYPNIDVSYTVPEVEAPKGGDVFVEVSLEREIGTEYLDFETLELVNAPLYPENKHESWWLIVGIEKDNTLLAIKRVTIKIKEKVKLGFSIPEDASPGVLNCKLYLFCDSYVGVDQEYDFAVTVGESEDMEL